MFTLQTTSAPNPAEGPAAAHVLVARQPILDHGLQLYAWELLYRSHQDDELVAVDGARATASVITASFMDIGLDRLLEGHPAFINVTREFLLSRAALALPPERVVLEILENVMVDEELVDAVRELVRKGYRIALDDFTYDERWLPLLELAHLVKIDVLALSLDEVREHRELLAAHGVELVAEKVETEAQYLELREMGFVLFQGYFFARPNVITGTRVPANRLAVLRLLARIHDPDTEMDELAELVAHDPAVAYRLMRTINSAALALPAPVTSVQRAVVYLGLAALKRWVSLIALASMDDKPSALTRLTLTRARMCEQLAGLSGACDAGTAFTVGLFSTLDAFMDQPLAEVLAQLPLAPDVVAALTQGAGPTGDLLQCALAYECGDWDRARTHSRDVSFSSLSEVYAEAVEWADGVSTVTAN